MKDYSKEFGPFDNAIWLNCAHQGPLPKVAVAQAEEAIAWKIAPYKMTTERFSQVPLNLKRVLGKLIDAVPEDIILGNSASYGLHLLANGIRWKTGDEILLVEGDFPSDLLPWMGLRNKGVNIRFVKPRQYVIQPDELLRSATSSTRLLCTTLVHSFSGFAVDVRALGEICRAKGILLVLNVSQALGARSFKVSEASADAIVGVGFKWLCGPYGTGYCWIDPSLRESLQCNQSYWLAMQTADDLAKEQGIPVLRDDLGARRFDVFGTANFFNFKPLAASIEYLLEQGIENIAEHDQRLITRLIQSIDRRKYDLLSPLDGALRSTLVFISHKDPARNGEIYEKLRKENVFVAYRTGKLRFSPHLYNTEADIDQALSVLNAV
jgi:cysteine desulfurase / selenocysteine lyase